jgi:hypothetical protein
MIHAKRNPKNRAFKASVQRLRDQEASRRIAGFLLKRVTW